MQFQHSKFIGKKLSKPADIHMCMMHSPLPIPHAHPMSTHNPIVNLPTGSSSGGLASISISSWSNKATTSVTTLPCVTIVCNQKRRPIQKVSVCSATVLQDGGPCVLGSRSYHGMYQNLPITPEGFMESLAGGCKTHTCRPPSASVAQRCLTAGCLWQVMEDPKIAVQ